MSYVLNQYNQPVVDKSDTSSENNQIYMTQLTGGTPKRKESSIDLGVSSSQDLQLIFYNECIQFGSPLVKGSNYYFHCKIKRLNSNQVFYIYLINYDDNAEDASTQYLRTITIGEGPENEWVDFEMIFSPLLNFDCILFQMQRTADDYRVAVRYPYFCYEELSQINNIVTNKTNARSGLFKMGIQSRPGLMMCLNKEEIHVGRSGVYEVRNGLVVVDFLSVVAAATENPNGANPITNPDTGEVMTLDEFLAYIGTRPVIEGKNETNSKCIFDNSKERRIDAFTLDYMYEVEEE